MKFNSTLIPLIVFMMASCSLFTPSGDKGIRARLTDNIENFRSCYIKAYKKNKRFPGTVKMVFTVKSDGKVTKAKAVSAEFSRSMKRCIVKKIKKIQFPKPKDGGYVEVSQPIHFKPREK